MNVSMADKIFQPILFSYPFQRSTIAQSMFQSTNLRTNMPKSTSFLLKNRKKSPVFGALPPDPHSSRISLRNLRCELNYNRRFYVI